MMEASQSHSEQSQAQRHLESLLLAARDHQVTPEAAARSVAEIQRYSSIQRDRDAAARTRLWGWTLGTGLAVAALLLSWLPWRTPNVARTSATDVPTAPSALSTSKVASHPAPVQVGERVALAIAPGTEYVVAAANADSTIIEVTGGSVTARLYPDAEHHHELILQANDLRVRATGTVFTVGLGTDGEPYSVVHEGSVAATRGSAQMQIAAGHSYPADAPNPPRLGEAAQRLAQHTLTPPTPPPSATPPDAGAPETPTATPARARNADPVQLWREARALRSAGKPHEAIERLETLRGLGTTTWTPLAHLEIARIYDSELSDPERALQRTRSFVKKYEHHALTPEAIEMICQELDQLGRSDASLCP